MKPHSDKSDHINQLLDKAWRSIAAAQRNLIAGDHDFAVSRAYYAAFYGMEAVLITKDLVFSKHAATISAFNKHFIKTGVFPKIFGKYINKLFSERQLGDYAANLQLGHSDADEGIRMAEEIVQKIAKYLEKPFLGKDE